MSASRSSSTITWRPTPICGAARPTPGALRMTETIVATRCLEPLGAPDLFGRDRRGGLPEDGSACEDDRGSSMLRGSESGALAGRKALWAREHGAVCGASRRGASVRVDGLGRKARGQGSSRKERGRPPGSAEGFQERRPAPPTVRLDANSPRRPIASSSCGSPSRRCGARRRSPRRDAPAAARAERRRRCSRSAGTPAALRRYVRGFGRRRPRRW